MLDDLRQRIDALDDRLLDLLAERRTLVREVLDAKRHGALALRHPEREQELLVRLVRRGRELGLQAPFVMAVFRAVIGDSLRLQQEELQRDHAGTDVLRIAYLGQRGSFSSEAARDYAARRAARFVDVASASFEDVLNAVEDGRADVGALPVENSTSGGINEAYDLLMHTRLSIIGELRLPVEHCLCGIDGSQIDGLSVIYSHPQPAAQCSRRLRDWGVRVEYVGDTAAAAARVAEEGRDDVAAIASAAAAERFGLRVLEDRIANDPANATRFLFVARGARPVDSRIPCKTSLVMATAQRAGSLVDALLVFRDAGIVLTKLESRPVPANAWEEMFYVDVQAHVDEPEMQQALRRLEAHTRSVRVLGSYPSDDLPPPEIA